MNKVHCITSYNIEQDELMCISHQVKLCVVCGTEIAEDESKCLKCLGYSSEYAHRSN